MLTDMARTLRPHWLGFILGAGLGIVAVKMGATDYRWSRGPGTAASAAALQRDERTADTFLAALMAGVKPSSGVTSTRCAFSPRAAEQRAAIVARTLSRKREQVTIESLEVVVLRPGRWEGSGAEDWSTPLMLRVKVKEAQRSPATDGTGVFYTMTSDLTGGFVPANGDCPAIWQVKNIAGVPAEWLSH